MKYSIGLEKARFYAYHGVYEAEQILGNWFEVSICVSADIADAGSDVLADTVNYESLYGICAREMRIRSLLIEQVAHRIVVAVARELPAVQSIRLRLAKLNPPLGGVVAQSFVEVEKNFFVDN
ncbi:MAG: dihydroneopterin aldolase [Sphingobacteriales bacterium]|nr:dihydroneopterin aldolase [Sphingobacteriales bacterium]